MRCALRVRIPRIAAGGKHSIKQAMHDLIDEVDREADRQARAEAMRPVREEVERQAKMEAELAAAEEAERQKQEEAKAEADRLARAESDRLSKIDEAKKQRFEKLSQTGGQPSVGGDGPLLKAADEVIRSATCPLTEMDMSSVAISSWGISRQHFEAMGERKGLTRIAREFYMQGVYPSPILGKLFAIKDDTHPHDLVLFLMHLMQVDDTYMKLRDHSYYAVKTLHGNARHNPERDRCPAGAGTSGGHWTVSQRDEWKGLFLRACTRNKVPAETVEELGQFVDRVMQFYGPFVADRAH